MLEKGRIPSLDGFRAISIVVVIFSHVAMHSTLPTWLSALAPVADIGSLLIYPAIGRLGVRIFFIISGFLITYLLLKERAKTGSIDLKSFYIRRFLRIFPVFYFYLLVIALLNVVLDLEITSLMFLSSALYIQNFGPWGGHWLIGHSWSLAVEEQFYLLWPAIFVRIKKLESVYVWLAVVGLGSMMRAFHYKAEALSEFFLAPFFMYADFLFSGCLLAFLLFYHYDVVVAKIKQLNPVIIYIAIGLIWWLSKIEYHADYDKITVPLAGAIINVGICLLLVYFILKKNTIGYRFLNNPTCAFFGRLSYSLYVWQQLFMSELEQWWTQFPQNLLLTFGAAYLSYQFIEKPFLRLKDNFKEVKTASVPPKRRAV